MDLGVGNVMRRRYSSPVLSKYMDSTRSIFRQFHCVATSSIALSFCSPKRKCVRNACVREEKCVSVFYILPHAWCLGWNVIYLEICKRKSFTCCWKGTWLKVRAGFQPPFRKSTEVLLEVMLRMRLGLLKKKSNSARCKQWVGNKWMVPQETKLRTVTQFLKMTAKIVWTSRILFLEFAQRVIEKNLMSLQNPSCIICCGNLLEITRHRTEWRRHLLLQQRILWATKENRPYKRVPVIQRQSLFKASFFFCSPESWMTP